MELVAVVATPCVWQESIVAPTLRCSEIFRFLKYFYGELQTLTFMQNCIKKQSTCTVKIKILETKIGLTDA